MAKQNYFPIARQEQAMAVVNTSTRYENPDELMNWHMCGPSVLVCNLIYASTSLIEMLKDLGYYCIVWPESEYEVRLAISDLLALDNLSCPQLG